MKSYSQIVRHPGNSPLFDMLDLSVTGALRGIPIHIHAEGLRGTGKTTIIRAYKQVLPKIKRIKGCLFNCDPLKPHCPDHRNLTEEDIQKIGIETINMPFLEISPSAKKGTIVGSIDLKKLSSKHSPEAALLLGTIPKAHRGIIFVDEINRIADTSPEIVDLLLDVMGTKPGRIQIEEAGLPVIELPVQVSVWAASNPDEDPGALEDIRRQLSDRFDFTVNVERPRDPAVINKIFTNGESKYDHDYDLLQQKVKSFVEAVKIMDEYEPALEIKNLFSSMYVDYCLESIRSIEAALLGIKIRSALLKQKPCIDDIVFITRYALRHRVDVKQLQEIIKNILQRKKAIEINSNPNLPVKSDDNNKTVYQKDSEINTEKSKFSRESAFEKLNKIISKLTKKENNLNKKPKITKAIKQTKQKNVVKAPSQKALPIKELKITEYVKTEEELKR